jgi:putative membrane protein
MSAPVSLSEADHLRVSEAVARAEGGSAGEIVTVLADRSDGYSDVSLAWAGLMALLGLLAMAIAPYFFLGLAERLQGGWVHDWTPRELFTLAAMVAAVTFGAMVLLQLIPALRFWLIPSPIKAKRVHDRALHTFRVGAEQRTTGRTGILIYLSMREQRAEVLADAAIAGKVDVEVWADALEALLAQVRRGDIAGGMCAAVEKVGAVLAVHVPRQAGDVNELPDRLIEI